MRLKKYNIKDRGFVHLWILFAIVFVVTAISLVGWKTYQNNSATTVTNPITAPMPNPTPTGSTGLRGYATEYPSHPFCASSNTDGPPNDCTSKFTQKFTINLIDVKSPDHIATYSSNENGEFAFDVLPGIYNIEAITSLGMQSEPQQVGIEQGKITAIILSFDSGIR